MTQATGAATVAVRDVELAIRQAGEGRTFVWGHHLLGSMAVDDEAHLFDWPDLAGRCRLVRYDARGHGRSGTTRRPADYRWESLALDLLGVAGTVDAEPVVLGGASMGCATAAHAAVLAPERVTGLVLVTPPTAWTTRSGQAAFYRRAAPILGTFGTRPMSMAARVLPIPDLPMLSLGRATLRHLGSADRRVVAAVLRGAAQSDLPPLGALAALRVPALVLAWRGDRSHPLSTATQLAEALPDAELHVARSAKDVRRWSALVGEFLDAVG
jgi:pimeloyl-ACP methyl ester carboxylesterase